MEGGKARPFVNFNIHEKTQITHRLDIKNSVFCDSSNVIAESLHPGHGRNENVVITIQHRIELNVREVHAGNCEHYKYFEDHG